MDLYDKTFINCMAAGDKDVDTDDAYNNPVVLKAMRHNDLDVIYKAELDYAIEELCIFIKLSKLLSDSKVRQKIAELLRSYLLYRRAINDIAAPVDKELDALYISIIGDNDISQTLERTLRISYQKINDTATPCAYDFFKRISMCE